MTTTPNSLISPQTPRTVGISFAGSSQSTQMDPATVAPTELLQATANGGLVTSVEHTGEETQTAEKVVLWIQPGGTGNWYVKTSGVMAAYTQAATDAQGAVTLVDKTAPDAAIRLGASDKLGVTHHVDQQSMTTAEIMDY